MAIQNHAKKKYQIHLKSHTGPIHVLLVNKDSDTGSPVVVQVPPTKEEMDLDEQPTQDQNVKPSSTRKLAKVTDLILRCATFLTRFKFHHGVGSEMAIFRIFCYFGRWIIKALQLFSVVSLC